MIKSIRFPQGELLRRILSAVILGGVAIWLTIYSPLSFYALLLVVAMLMYAEWLELTQDFPLLNRFGGLIYVGVPVWSMIALRGVDGPYYILSLFALVWATDIAAYFGGKRYGKLRLAPNISPYKTWEGLGFGMIASGIIGLLIALVMPFPTSPLQGLVIGMLIAIISQIGDLFESWLKRRAGVKNSGSLIPGHGGILDRVDGLIFAAPVYAILVMLLAQPGVSE